jgi:Na+-driven multidrug efflux pump
VLFGTMRAAGAVVAPLVIFFIGMVPARLGFIWFFEPALGLDAFWYAILFSSTVSVALAFSYYCGGWWKPRAGGEGSPAMSC